ncbi:HK97-gp10 family putative phage morphogenesis protein [Paenibacillaceae bacterium WGS1546]|uniref:HK97-gp10 family putative phage morphogenesis protein n=1 Tax=Cohnella sp. WGS1546 TaxID=3366810 RepID=UPI00372CF194
MARRKRRTSNTRIRVDGAEDVIRALQEADEEIKKKINDLIAEAAEIVFREADARAPVGETEKTRFSLRIETGISKKGNFYANVIIGARKGETTAESAFYVTFYEYGSSRQPPRPFMRPSMDKSRAKIRTLLREGLAKVIQDLGR